MSKKFVVFTDGSCLNNGKKNSVGSIGIFFSDSDPDNYAQVIENDGNKITNQTMELLACIQALKIIEEKIQKGIDIGIVYIFTDSTYVINCMTKWFNQWTKNNWKNSKGKPVDNKDLIELLHEQKSKYIVIFKHINAHQNKPDNSDPNYKYWYGNYMADKLATDASKSYMAKQIIRQELEQELINNQKLIANTESDIGSDIRSDIESDIGSDIGSDKIAKNKRSKMSKSKIRSKIRSKMSKSNNDTAKAKTTKIKQSLNV